MPHGGSARSECVLESTRSSRDGLRRLFFYLHFNLNAQTCAGCSSRINLAEATHFASGAVSGGTGCPGDSYFTAD